jgi:hypothetical protein
MSISVPVSVPVSVPDSGADSVTQRKERIRRGPQRKTFSRKKHIGTTEHTEDPEKGEKQKL